MIEIASDGSEIRIELLRNGADPDEGVSLPVMRGDQRALFLEEAEAETLGKMIDYILGLVRKGDLKIRGESQEALEELRPRLDSLFQDAEGDR